MGELNPSPFYLKDKVMKFEIVTPEKLIVSTEADYVSAPGSEGEFGVLEGHVPFMTTLRPGVIKVEVNGKETVYGVSGGTVDVTPESVTVLAEDVIMSADADIDKAQKLLQEAEYNLAGKEGVTDANSAHWRRQQQTAQAMLEMCK